MHAFADESLGGGGDGWNIWNGGHGASAAFKDGVADHIIRGRVLGQGDHHAAGMDDAGFLAGYLGDGVAKKFLVVERDVSDYGNQGFDDVSRVQTAAHADFKHSNVHFGPCEILKGDGGQHLKKTGMPGELAGCNQAFGSLFNTIMNSGEVWVGNFLAVDANALVQPNKVGRGVERRAVSGGAQN